MTVGSMDPQLLIDEARRATGLDDFHEDGFRDGFEALVETYNRLSLTEIGEIYIPSRLASNLATRLRLVETWQHHPEIRERSLGSPLYVVGLWRSGTSSLLNRLAADPRNRPLLFWEGYFPDPATEHPDPRIQQLRERIDMGRTAELDAIHYIDVDLPEECIVLLFHTFRDQRHGIEPVLEPYASWFAKRDFGPAYDYYLDALRTLDWRRPPPSEGRWLLKAPAHLWALEELVTRVPDARFVWTHRDPAEVVASYCSLQTTIADSRFAVFDRPTIGPLLMEYVAQCIDAAMSARDRLGDALHVVDVDYRQEVSDPFGVCEAVYEAHGLALDGALADTFREHSAAHPQHEHGRHIYRLDDYGLSTEQVRERFLSYLERFLPDLA
jgi:hypothetical protein